MVCMCLKCTRKVEINRPGNMFSVRETGMMTVQLSMLGYQKKKLVKEGHTSHLQGTGLHSKRLSIFM